VTAAPAWAASYVGLPYRDKGRGPDAFDCWGLVRAVLADVFHAELPDYADAYTDAADRDSVAAAVQAGLREGWQRVASPREGDLLILRVAGRPWHCAVMVAPRMFLHCPPPDARGRQLLSCIERVDAPMWARRIEGYYRHD